MFAPRIAKPEKKAGAAMANRPKARRSLFAGPLGDHDELGRDTRTSAPPGKSPPRPGWNFAHIPPYAPGRSGAPAFAMPPPRPGVLRAKLIIGDANDPLEAEADRIADQVMRMPDPRLSVASAPPQVSRKCAGCEEDGETLRMKAADGPGLAGAEAPARVREVLASPGQPLDAETRAFFEPRFASNLSEVRVHTGGSAAASARAIGARAFAADQHIVFGAGQWVPTSQQGRNLIAHELAHVVQGIDSNAPVRRAPGDVPAMDAELQAALGNNDMGEAARILNGFSPVDMLKRLATLTLAQRQAVQTSSLTQPGVGRQSAVADLASASVQARFFSGTELGASFDGLVDPGNGIVTIYKRIKFDANGAKFGMAAPGTPAWQQETIDGKRQFAAEFKSSVEATWSGQGVLRAACPIGTVTLLKTRVVVLPVESAEHTVVHIFSSGGGRSNAGEGQGNLQVGDNQPYTRERQGVDVTGKRPVKVTTTQTTSAHEFGHMLGLHHVRCPGGDQNCYGVTAEQMQDVMGVGNKLQVLKTNNKVVHDDFQPFERLAERWGRDVAGATAATCNKWIAST